jgi:hypothetical protein
VNDIMVLNVSQKAMFLGPQITSEKLVLPTMMTPAVITKHQPQICTNCEFRIALMESHSLRILERL